MSHLEDHMGRFQVLSCELIVKTVHYVFLCTFMSTHICVCRSIGWEPFIEPWPCFLDWQRQAAGRLHPPRLKIGVRAKQRLDVNITSVLLGT